MYRKKRKLLCLMLALLTAFSAFGTAVSAAEIADRQIAAVGAAAPQFDSIESVNEGVRIRWKQVENIYFYRIYRWYDDDRGWLKLQDTDLLEYVDPNVATGNTYQYRLVGISADGNILTPTSSQSFTYTATVKVSNTESTSDGIRVSWSKSAGAAEYALYRLDNGSWRRIATTVDSSYVDKNVYYGNSYTYTVRPLDANGGFLYESYDNTGVTHAYVSTPSLSVESAVDGVKISWNKVESAENYRVFYKNSKGGWTRLVLTDQTSFLDKDVRSGNNYTYTVRCTAQDGEHYISYFDTAGKSVKYIAAPVLVAADGTSDGVQITWKKSDGAAKYRVFRKTDSTSWSRIGDTTATSLTDKNASSGTSYTYTVRCMNSAGDYISAFYPGIKGTYLTNPDFSVSNGYDGVNISWKAVKGAENYRVYCYTSKGWARIADTDKTSYSDTKVTSGNSYTYTVRCINAEGTAFTSGYNAGKSTKFVAAPKITTLINTTEGMRISWGAVGGAQKYRLYYYGTNGWTRIADTTDTTYLNKNVASGTTYRYTVRCINKEANAFMSTYRQGESLKYIAAPEIELTRNAKSITVNWNSVEGAELYRVYCRDGNSWKKIADTTKTSYEDKTVVSGSSYTYTVRCLNADGTAFTSDYRAGKSMKIVDTPYISSVRNGETGVEVEWGAVAGAEKYRLYYKNGNDWIKITETAETSFNHTAAQSGRDYTYTVRCVSADGKSFDSSFDRVGKSIHYIAAPQNIRAIPSGNGIKISWKASDGAAKYRVYYYGSKGWTRMTETTDTSYQDNDVASGKTYRYTVRCVSADGKSFTSDFNHDGAVCKFTTTPVLNAIDYEKDGTVISWKASPGTEKYRVYVLGDNGWTKIAETTETSITDKSVTSGKTYRYTVRGLTADGKAFTSDYDHSGVSAFYVAAPKMLTMSTDSDKVVFSWSKPRGATKYRVYKKSGGTWKRMTDTTANSYTDKDISVGSTYTYTVRVINDESNRFYSGFDPTGFVVTVTTEVSDFRYYDQTQYSYPYGDDTIAGSGCGPTCFAMVASTLKGKSITPIDAVAWCGNSYYLMGVGTYWDYFRGASEYFGITMEKQLGANSFDSVIAALKQGKYVISAQSAGIFTRGGHFIVLAGITSSGKIIVYDPNGGNHYAGTAFDPSDITASGTQYWVFSK